MWNWVVERPTFVTRSLCSLITEPSARQSVIPLAVTEDPAFLLTRLTTTALVSSTFSIAAY